MFIKLTKKQEEVLEDLLHSIERKEHFLMSSEDRAIGKTLTLNELAFILQALGYHVLILTPYRNQEYFADQFISLDSKDYRSKLKSNSAVIADESRFEMMKDFLDYCESRKVSVVGYVNFRVSRPSEPIEFKREYENIWIGGNYAKSN